MKTSFSAALIVTSIPLAAQVSWFSSEGRFDHGLAPNPGGAGLVLFGGSSSGSNYLDDLWVRDLAGGWRQRNATEAPVGRRGHAMARVQGADDAVFVMLTGGVRVGAVRTAEAWRYNGDNWTLGPPMPIPRSGHASAWDSSRGRLVLFGGEGDGGPLNDVLEFDGATNQWLPRTPSGAIPAARFGHAMAFDANRGKVLLFGGSGNRADTHEYDGAQNGGGGAWLAIATGSAPAGRRDHALAFDAANGQVVLFGGRDGGQAFDDTWVYDPNAATWVLRTPATSPLPRYGHRMEYDSLTQSVMMVGGASFDGRLLDDTWRWTGANWLRADAEPAPRSDPFFEHDGDRRVSVLFGGYSGDPFAPFGDTWTLDGVAWRRLTPALSPSARFNTGGCYDPIRRRLVLFGGRSGNTMLGDTWTWDGVVWSQSMPATSPSARHEPVMAFDHARGNVVLFGGKEDLAGALRNDTWTWNGTAWVEQFPQGPLPSPRVYTAMAFDAVSRRVILFGGLDAETWAWEGVSWTQLQPSTSPPGRWGHQLVSDSLRGRLVLHGGYSLGQQDLADVWEWDGSDWVLRANVEPPQARKFHALAFDAARGRTVMIGGFAGWASPTLLGDTWEYGTVAPARSSSFGTGCAGSNGRVPLLTCPAPHLPWLGGTCRLAVGDLAAGAIAVMYLGASNVVWQGNIPLPLSLAPLMPGCFLRVSLDVAIGSVASPSGYVAIGIPLDTQFLGQTFFTQAVVVDLPANLAGVVLSNALEARFGMK